MYDKIIISAIIFAETILFCYSPKIAEKFAKYRNEWINVDNLNNATSGKTSIEQLKKRRRPARTLNHTPSPRGLSTQREGNDDFRAHRRAGLRDRGPDTAASHNRLSGRALGIDEERGDVEAQDKTSSNTSTSGSDNMSHKIPALEFIWINLRRIFCSRSLYLLMAFYGHSVLEGSLIGSESGPGEWAMAFGIIAHKWAECLLLSSIITNIMKSELMKNLCIVLFSLCVPVGVLVGYYTVSKSDGIYYSVFSLLAVGFFIYLSFELFTGNTGQKTSSRVILWAFFIFGALLMSILLAGSNLIEGTNQGQTIEEKSQ